MNLIDITKVNYPTIFEACETLSHDGGASAGHATYAVDARWEAWLPEIEEQLKRIDARDGFDTLEEFCIGEHDAQLQTADSEDAWVAHAFLTTFFMGGMGG